DPRSLRGRTGGGNRRPDGRPRRRPGGRGAPGTVWRSAAPGGADRVPPRGGVDRAQQRAGDGPTGGGGADASGRRQTGRL
ncbi:MAG: hypothetical protein AVDCRST_MAG73-3057, partial [uncultured Thermomicrobiales bacterium]